MELARFSAGVGSFVPAQRLQAQRDAAAAEGRADRLARESELARREADRLLERAGRLEADSAQARGDANEARRSAGEVEATRRVGQPQSPAVSTASLVSQGVEGAVTRAGADVAPALQAYASVGQGGTPTTPGLSLQA